MRPNPFVTKSLIGLLTLSVVSSQFFCTSSAPEKAGSPDTSAAKVVTDMDRIAKGAALVHIGGCNDCHSPKIMTPMGPIPDTTRLLSGHVANSPLPDITYDATKPGNWILMSADLTTAVGPWGMTHAANLTPDSTTGLGSWTVANFIGAMRTGKHLGQEGGRPILPPMPWPALGKLTDEELSDMFLYLRSLPAISNLVPAPKAPNEVVLKK